MEQQQNGNRNIVGNRNRLYRNTDQEIREHYKCTKKRSNLARDAMKVYLEKPKKRRVHVTSHVTSTGNANLKPRDWKQRSVRHRQKFERLLELSKSNPERITMINGNGVCFEEEFAVGTGSNGTEVFICLGSDGIERAIKRLPKHLCKTLLNERDILNSPNAVQSRRIVNYCFYNDTSNPDFRYLVLNLYEQNLEEYIRKEGEKITEGRARKMVRQVLEGLKALHTREPRILHRDLKPTNILIDVDGNVVLSDFGIGRFFLKKGETTYRTSAESGSYGWVAYECIDWDRWFSDKPSNTPIQLYCKEKSDIQVAAMIIFYILTNGKHPFGPPIHRMKNLHDDNPVSLNELGDPVVKDLMSQMLARDLDERPYVEQALKHPYFLSIKEQMKFVEAVGNEPKLKISHNDVSHELDNCHPSKPQSSLLPNDWKTVIGDDDLKTLCPRGYRPPSAYNGCQYTNCLRLIRNTLQHPDGKLHQLQAKTPTTASLEEYFFQLFPNLPLVLHQIIRKYPDWTALPALKEFFPVVDRSAASDHYDSD